VFVVVVEQFAILESRPFLDFKEESFIVGG